jgi:hypothetical protein
MCQVSAWRYIFYACRVTIFQHNESNVKMVSGVRYKSDGGQCISHLHVVPLPLYSYNTLCGDTLNLLLLCVEAIA